MEPLIEWARGEPVALAGFISALLAGVGIYVAPGLIAQLIAAMVPVIGAALARRHTTPAANPAIPHQVVDSTTGAPVPTPQRVRSCSLATRLSDLPAEPRRR